jgi:type IV pilus assembly protein PilV
MSNPLKAPGRHAQAGASLVESLVALVVLSVGMLGVAGLMLTGISSNRSALYRTQAVNLVSDMADRIRANTTARGAYDTLRYGGNPALRGCAASAAAVGGNCTLDELAEDDLARWIDSVRTALPPYRGDPAAAEVTFLPAGFAGQPDTYRIRVGWHEPREQQDFDYQIDLALMPRARVN